jgi:glc operon protein GlcG
MTMQNKNPLAKLALAALAFAGIAAAQSNIDKFTVTGEMAKKAMIRGEINVATAEKLNQVCVDFAKQKKLEVANVILAPSGAIVLAYRMDGNAQSPFIMETALLRAKTALARHQSTRALYNAAEGNGDISREVRYFATPNTYAVPGGVPIVVDDQIIGAMGTSGMGEPDEDCIYEALNKVIGPQPKRVPKLPRPKQFGPGGPQGEQPATTP